MLSKRQRQIYELISSFQNTNGYSPTYRELQKMLGLSSVGTVQKHVQKIKAEGLLESTRAWRGLRSSSPKNSFGTPIIGTLSKTGGIELFMQVELTPIALAEKSRDCYGFRIKDNSFSTEGFYKDDLIIILASAPSKEGALVLLGTKEGLQLCPLAKQPSGKVHGTVQLLVRSFIPN
jgi:repressor LexA